jgi:hypothetical protein
MMRSSPGERLCGCHPPGSHHRKAGRRRSAMCRRPSHQGPVCGMVCISPAPLAGTTGSPLLLRRPSFFALIALEQRSITHFDGGGGRPAGGQCGKDLSPGTTRGQRRGRGAVGLAGAPGERDAGGGPTRRGTHPCLCVYVVLFCAVLCAPWTMPGEGQSARVNYESDARLDPFPCSDRG